MSHCGQTEIDTELQADKKIVLAGNPNVGKSIFFNYLTGIYVSVSNYPGTTLDISSGKMGDAAVYDTPGVYGVGSINDEERVARDIIMSADIIINVVDASHLERDLFLTQQLIDLDKKIIVALNMMDEVEKNNISIDLEALEKELGVPVIPTTAAKNRGLDKLKHSIDQATKGNSIFTNNQELAEEVKNVESETGNKADALMILEEDENIRSQYSSLKTVPALREEIYTARRQRVDQITDQVLSYDQNTSQLARKIGAYMLKPVTAIPMLLVLLYIIYQFIGVFVAQTVVGVTEELIFVENYEPFVRNIIANTIGLENFFGQLLAGEYGILTMAVTYIFGLLLPLVAGFYFLLSILEDSGYLPRIAVLMDRLLQKIGLNGRAIIPMLLGFGCVTMATITTRLLGTKRERIISIFLLGLAIPCSAQLGVIAGLIAQLDVFYILVYVLTIFAVYVLAGTFLNKVLPGESSDLLIDLPPIRLPDLKNVFNKTYQQTAAFVKEAGPIFVLGAALITVMQKTGLLALITRGAEPITVNWLGLPAETATAFVMGIIRRDFGAAGLTSIALTPAQITISLITLTLFVPCIAAMMIMIKERNFKESVYIWFGSWITAFITGGLVNLLIF
ncbi:ferrous iron transport protein B [Halanaerobium saccharolyticum]|uniref:Ferrous iron transport protein B n=1 Tax=Halanaerobium saccharolyticum TaxID=43595 RepID=A0A4R7Z4K9_9FIRM|nr:ferrous iron transport protein B [Halanaerobium saccharolyticum]RAK10316.1 ferrous iron transport protein B [Halanaerobium saccharolyticum]TDW05262.1 ferrous iron transport protein B [Halanaerobium saccharolyticum]TDX60332.1 ferrous iron transport protein B [Halanaerobium saccharolyticum]